MKPSFFYEPQEIKKTNDEEKNYSKTLKISKISGKILIIGNQGWLDFKNAGDCTGQGTKLEPYIIEDLVIDGGGSGIGILIENTDVYYRIEDCTVFNCKYGIYLYYAHNGALINNNCSYNGIHDDNGYAIRGSYSNNLNVSGNFLYKNGDSTYYASGMRLWSCNNSIVSGNIAKNNSNWGLYISHSINNTISGNTANYNVAGIGIVANNNTIISKNNVSSNKYNGIYVGTKSYNNTVLKNFVNNNKIGIEFWGSFSYDIPNNYILGNVMINNELYGIYISRVYNLTLSNNTISNSRNGIGLGNANNIKILKNIVYNNTMDGMYLTVIENSTISKNIVYNNSKDGIHFYSKPGVRGFNTISENKVYNNSERGIYIEISQNNTVKGNIIRDNAMIGLDFNPYLGPHGNLVYNNSFINNGIHAIDSVVIYPSYLSNKWDNGAIGNYWDDYTGIDENDDGIGDTPYNIAGTAGSKDRFPIWEDGPNNEVNLPKKKFVSGLNAPNFNVENHHKKLDEIWYTINLGTRKFFVYFNETVNQTAWSALSEGPVILRFYANDTEGNTNYEQIDGIKDTNAPNITIYDPSEGSKFGNLAPTLSLQINDVSLNKTWYILNEEPTKYYFIISVGLTMNVSIGQNSWESLPEGDVKITIYADDGLGRISFIQIRVIKDIPIGKNNGGGLNDDDEEVSQIPFGNYYLLFAAISIISLTILKKRKAIFSKN